VLKLDVIKHVAHSTYHVALNDFEINLLTILTILTVLTILTLQTLPI